VPRGRRRTSLAVAGVASVLLVGACGDDDAGSDAAPVTTTTDPAVAGADVFTDPGGAFHLSVGPTWVQVGTPGEGPSGWAVPGPDGAQGIVSVEALPVPPSLAAEDVAESVAEELGVSQPGYVAESFETIERGADETVTVIEATAQRDGAPIDLLQVVVVDGRDAVFAQLTTASGELARFRDDVEPFLLTATPG
jgi:hypothetical protein